MYIHIYMHVYYDTYTYARNIGAPAGDLQSFCPTQSVEKCVCVCVYIYLYIYIHTIYVYIHIYIHACTKHKRTSWGSKIFLPHTKHKKMRMYGE